MQQRQLGQQELHVSALGQYLAENHGVAIVPGAFFSPFGGEWIRFSYATPVERTEGAFKRLVEGLESLKK